MDNARSTDCTVVPVWSAAGASFPGTAVVVSRPAELDPGSLAMRAP